MDENGSQLGAALVVGYGIVLASTAAACVVRWPGPAMVTLLFVSASCCIGRLLSR